MLQGKTVKKIIANSALAVALLPLSSHAGIGNNFGYIGLSSQYNDYTDLDFTPDATVGDFAPSQLSQDTEGFGTRFFYGMHFSQHFAAEVGANFASDASFKLKNGNTVQHKGEFSTFGIDVKAIGTWPITNSQYLKAHVGALVWNNEFEYLSGVGDTASVKKDSNTKLSAIYGLGYGYAFNKNNALLLEFESSKIADVRVDSISLSFLVKI